MIQSVKCLLYKYEDMSLASSKPCRHWPGIVCLSTGHDWRWRQEKSQRIVILAHTTANNQWSCLNKVNSEDKYPRLSFYLHMNPVPHVYPQLSTVTYLHIISKIDYDLSKRNIRWSWSLLKCSEYVCIFFLLFYIHISITYLHDIPLCKAMGSLACTWWVLINNTILTQLKSFIQTLIPSLFFFFNLRLTLGLLAQLGTIALSSCQIYFTYDGCDPHIIDLPSMNTNGWSLFLHSSLSLLFWSQWIDWSP